MWRNFEFGELHDAAQHNACPRSVGILRGFLDSHGFNGAGACVRVDAVTKLGSTKRFVCVLNRARDSYQVPLGLHEAGLLDALVTDYYTPDAAPSWLPAFLRNKRHAGLPGRLTRSDWAAFTIQYAAQVAGRFVKLPGRRIWALVDRRLGYKAGRTAAELGANLYCYHNYVPANISDQQCLIVFVFHPLANSFEALIEQDVKRFPYTADLFRSEQRAEYDPFMPVSWERPDAIVCASRATARSIIAQGAPPERIAVIPYGLPSGAENKVNEVVGDGRARFLFVGNGLQRKGIHHLLKVWSSQRRDRAELTIVSYDLDPAVAALADGDASVRVLGYQSRQELDNLFARSDVFVMPSILEGFGLVYLEALAAGCHVIATPNTGVADLNLGPEAVTLVPPSDLVALDSAIDACISKVRHGGFDQKAIASQGQRWRQSDFRKAIGEHARAVRAWREEGAPYPTKFGYEQSGGGVVR